MADEKKADYYTGPQAGDFAAAAEPFALFEAWFAEAVAHEPNDPNAFALATVDASGLPNVRMVLLKGLDAPDHPDRGFVFYTNFESAKGDRVAGLQEGRARISTGRACAGRCASAGLVSVVSDAEADAYFATRPRGSRLGAWASQQSRPLESRVRAGEGGGEVTARYPLGEIPRPPYWSGFRVTPLRDGVLARPSVPPARAGGVPAERRRRGLDEAAAVSVMRTPPRRQRWVS